MICNRAWFSLERGIIMKQYTLTNWDNSITKKGLLLFAETAEEMLFHHSHDSFKVPTLNFKYLCYDIIDKKN